LDERITKTNIKSTDLSKLLSEFNQNIKLDYDLKKKNWN